MESITRFIWFLLLLGLVGGSRTPSSNEVTLNSILQHKDNSADPCEDFQKFSSGKFAAVHKKDAVGDLPESISHQMNIRMQKVLEHLPYRVLVDESSVEEKVWRFYDTCLTAPEATQSWRHFLELVPPGKDLSWPLFREVGWPKEKFNWLETLARLRRFGAGNLIIRLEVRPDFRDMSQNLIYISRPEMNSIPSVETTKNLLISLGYSNRRAADLALGITALDADLHGLPGEEDYLTYITLKMFEDQTQIALSKYLEIAFGKAINSSQTIMVAELKYMDKLQLLVEKYDNEVVASYLMVGFIRFLRDLPGSQPRGDPLQCSTTVLTHMPFASELLYKNHYFGKEIQERFDQEVRQLFQRIRVALSARLDRNRLNLTVNEVFFLKEKLRTMKVRLGELPKVSDQRRFVNIFYSDLVVDPVSDLAKIQLKAQEHQTGRVLQQLDKPIFKTNRYYKLPNGIVPLNSMPYFHISGNVIIVPYGFLQDPYFSPSQHDVFKVSLLGYILAYQMLNTFRSDHLKYDSEIKINHLMERFEANQGSLEGLACLRGTQPPIALTLVHNVGALGLIYDVYFGEDSKFNREQPNFTNLPLEQLFLLNFAQTSVDRSVDYTYYGHSEKLSLHQAVSNLRAFGNVFKCPVRAKLNPPIKCQVW